MHKNFNSHFPGLYKFNCGLREKFLEAGCQLNIHTVMSK